MARKLTCDFCGVEVFDSTDPVRPKEQTKHTVAVYREQAFQVAGESDVEMLDRDACAKCADQVARILAACSNRTQLETLADTARMFAKT